MKGTIVRGVMIAAAAAALAGCSSASETLPKLDQVNLSVDRSSYTTGMAVTVTIVNNTAHDVGYNLCVREIQKQSGGTYTTVVTQPEPNTCDDQLSTLGPNLVTTTTVDLPTSLTGGSYRVYFPNLGTSSALPMAQKVTPAFVVRSVG